MSNPKCNSKAFKKRQTKYKFIISGKQWNGFEFGWVVVLLLFSLVFCVRVCVCVSLSRPESKSGQKNGLTFVNNLSCAFLLLLHLVQTHTQRSANCTRACVCVCVCICNGTIMERLFPQFKIWPSFSLTSQIPNSTLSQNKKKKKSAKRGERSGWAKRMHRYTEKNKSTLGSQPIKDNTQISQS